MSEKWVTIFVDEYPRRCPESKVQRAPEHIELPYLDRNKERTERWMQGLGLQLPSDASTFGSIGTITDQGGTVKIAGVPSEKAMPGRALIAIVQA